MPTKPRRVSWYPGFDVTKEQFEWDPHTRQVVMGRLQYQRTYSWLTEAEVVVVQAIAETLVADDREPILRFMVHHLDGQMTGDIGESQREQGVPTASQLVRQALTNLDRAATVKVQRRLLSLQPAEREALLRQMERGAIDWLPDWDTTQQQAAFSKLATTLVKAYYAHPTIWSEIGYAGPAYPRGYLRSEFGLTDPWEARRP